MAVKIIGTVIGALVFGGGLYYFSKEKNDLESRKIYGAVSGIGGLMFAVMLILTVTSL